MCIWPIGYYPLLAKDVFHYIKINYCRYYGSQWHSFLTQSKESANTGLQIKIWFTCHEKLLLAFLFSPFFSKYVPWMKIVEDGGELNKAWIFHGHYRGMVPEYSGHFRRLCVTSSMTSSKMVGSLKDFWYYKKGMSISLFKTCSAKWFLIFKYEFRLKWSFVSLRWMRK